MRIFIIGHTSPDLDATASTIEYKEYLEKANAYEKAEIIPTVASDINGETKYIFERFDAEIPLKIDSFEVLDEDKFILVDHNEQSQRSPIVESEKIIEIIDHHKINISFTLPLKIDVRPVGSTSTIIYELFETKEIAPSKKIASIMLASILSDTQGLKSSTTTGIDSTAAHRLTSDLHLDIDRLTFDIFKAKSDISGLNAIQVVKKDYKVFDFSGRNVFIGQVETVEPEKVLEQKEELVKALEEVKVSEGAEQAYLVVTDILNVNSQIVYATDAEKEIVEKAFTTQGISNVADIGPMMSRKKDIAPAIETSL
ncbi:manganese-dependent inorganic pyrophosphatase [candidate division WWE3 bacterium]|nr:manganese-dependent inorganic pyrophosphatase [candidate division WWE3 bacterium]